MHDQFDKKNSQKNAQFFPILFGPMVVATCQQDDLKGSRNKTLTEFLG